MRIPAQLLLMTAMLVLGPDLFAQPVIENDTAGAWVGAGLWLAITAAFLIAMFVLLWKGLKRPNR